MTDGEKGVGSGRDIKQPKLQDHCEFEASVGYKRELKVNLHYTGDLVPKQKQKQNQRRPQNALHVPFPKINVSFMYSKLVLIK